MCSWYFLFNDQDNFFGFLPVFLFGSNSIRNMVIQILNVNTSSNRHLKIDLWEINPFCRTQPTFFDKDLVSPLPPQSELFTFKGNGSVNSNSQNHPHFLLLSLPARGSPSIFSCVDFLNLRPMWQIMHQLPIWTQWLVLGLNTDYTKKVTTHYWYYLY